MTDLEYRKNIYKQIRYEQNDRVDKLIEEMSELIQALIKYRFQPHSKKRFDNIIEEIADVEILLEENKMKMKIEHLVDEQKAEKIAWLKERVGITYNEK